MSGDKPLQTTLLDAIQQAVIATDADRRITYWNRFAEQLYGWTADEVLGRDIIDVTPAQAAAGEAALLPAKSGETWAGEFVVKHKSGKTFPAFVTVSPIKDPKGRPIGAVGVSYDLSGRNQRELSYDALFMAMSEGFALCEAIVDADGRLADYVVVEMNAALQTMLGVGPEAVGTKLSASGTPNRRWLAVCDGVLRSGEPANFDYHNPNTGRWHEIRISRVGRDRLAQFFFDITERKLADAEVQESRSYLRLILDSAADAFYCVDRDGVTTHCNAAFLRLLGFRDEGEAIGRKLHDVIHHSHPDGSRYDKQDCPIYQGARSGEARHVDGELFYRLDGSSFPVEYWVQPILRGGVVQGAICTFHDITARKAAEETQDLLLREMNHRVKNLFAVIDGVVGLSSRTTGSPKEVAEAIRGRLAAIARAHELILPSLLRSDGARARRTDLATLANAVLAPYAGGGADHAAPRLSMEGPHVVIGDKAASALALVLHEMATNAVKYGALSRESGRVRIDWSATDDHLALRWEETGGPVVDGPPAAEGFGSLLARRSVAGQLSGRFLREWTAEGLRVSISAPLQHVGGL